MKDSGPQPAEELLVGGSFQLDIEAIVEQIIGELGGIASRSDIRKALMEAAPGYKGARIKTYVPILLRKEVVRRLQEKLTHYQSAEEPESEDSATGTSAASSSDETVELAEIRRISNI